MEIGISLSSTTSKPGPASAAHLIARARAAAGAELASLSLGDHHAVPSPSGYFQNTPALGRLLAEWTGRPAGCLFLLPQWPPVLVAEQVGTLAALHDGAFIVQTGLGRAPDEFAAMGQSADHRVSVFEEGVRVVQALLAGDVVSSERFGFDDVSIGLVPTGPIDWWMGTGNPAGLRRAARYGAAWYAGPGGTLDEFHASDGIYRQACADAGAEPRVMVRRDVLVLRDAARAHRLADEAIARGYRGMTKEQLVVGGTSEAVARLGVWAEAGVDQVVVRTMGIDPLTDLETIECLADVRRAVMSGSTA